MESWMLEVLIVTCGAVGTYAVVRQRLTRLEKDFEQYVDKEDKAREKSNEYHNALHKDILERINAGFKKTDEMQNKITILERDTATHLTMPKAEEKFVSKMELELHLKNIEIITQHTAKSVDLIMGKLDLLAENYNKKVEA